MLPFVAPHAIAIGQAKHKASKAHADRVSATAVQRGSGKNLLQRVFDALAQARLRKAELEIATHRRLHGLDRLE